MVPALPAAAPAPAASPDALPAALPGSGDADATAPNGGMPNGDANAGAADAGVPLASAPDATAASAAAIDSCASAPNARSVASVARCTSSAWIADCSMPRLSFSHCSTARRSVIHLSSSSTLASGAIMSDIADSDGGSPWPGAAPMPAPNGESRIMSHIRSSMSDGLKPAKPENGLEPEVSVMRQSFVTGSIGRASGDGA